MCATVHINARAANHWPALLGVSLVAALAGAAIYGGRTTRQREVLIYALVTLFSAGLVLRAAETVGRLG